MDGTQAANLQDAAQMCPLGHARWGGRRRAHSAPVLTLIRAARSEYSPDPWMKSRADSGAACGRGKWEGPNSEKCPVGRAAPLKCSARRAVRPHTRAALAGPTCTQTRASRPSASASLATIVGGREGRVPAGAGRRTPAAAIWCENGA